MALPAWAPTVEDVAAVSPAYTRAPIEAGGEERGTFDETTDPTAGEVLGFIEAAVREITGRVGEGPLDAWADLAKQTAIWHAAATVEAERSPDGGDETTGAFSWKQGSYIACLNELISQARRVRPGID